MIGTVNLAALVALTTSQREHHNGDGSPAYCGLSLYPPSANDTVVPLFGAGAFSLRIPGGPTGGPFGDNKLVCHDEFLATALRQISDFQK